MAKDRAQPLPTVPANVYPTLPLSSVARVISNPLHQASNSVQEHGGASAPALHSALSSESVLTGLQDSFSTMSSNHDQTPRDFFPSSNDPFPDFSAFENYPFDSLQGDPHYTLASSSASSLNPRYLASSATGLDGVPSHQTGPDPWTHVDVTGHTSVVSDTTPPEEAGIPPALVRTPAHAHRPSSGSERQTFIDSAYATGPGKSQQASEVESIGEQHSEIMAQRHMNATPTPLRPTHPSSHSSTMTPTAPNYNQPVPEEQQSSARPAQRQSGFPCSECVYQAKTRSDLK
jgi:hypothetical protein